MSIIKKFAAILIIITSFYFLISSILRLPDNFGYFVDSLDRFDDIQGIIDIYVSFGWLIISPLSQFSLIILGVVLLFEKK